MFTSRTLHATGVALPCAVVLHLGFPRANLPWLMVPALAGLFAAWMSVGVRGAALVGFASGLVFFGLDFSWFGETAGALLGPFGALVVAGPAAIEAVAFAGAAMIASAAAGGRVGWLAAVSAALGFTAMEYLRSIGPLGAPLYHLSAAFVETPLAPIMAFGGEYALTFAVAVVAAAAAVALREPARAALRPLAVSVAAVAALAGAAWWGWPARHLGRPEMRVAAVQGDIRQSVKWQPEALQVAVDRYAALTQTLEAAQPSPQFVLWPETVVTTDLRLDPALRGMPANAQLVAQDARLDARFAGLARRLHATVAVGSIEATGHGLYDVLVFYAADGRVIAPYRKRALVPFAEFLPGPAWLRALPFASLVSDFQPGAVGGPVAAASGAAPLICWEAAFGDLAVRDADAGARFFAIATDDAWFGDTDGPYAQAQLAQVRAIETGRWIVRAAATGISGIIAPNGSWRERTRLDTQAVAAGEVGPPVSTFYLHVGPAPIGVASVVLTIVALLARRPRAVRTLLRRTNAR